MNSTPLKDISQLDSQKLLKESKHIIESVTQWNKSKHFTYSLKTGKEVGVQTYTSTINDDYWCARDSSLEELGDERASVYQDLLKYIVGSPVEEKKTHTKYETKYVEEIYDYKLETVEMANSANNSITYKGQMFYKFQFPLQKRVFHELLHIVKVDDDSEAYVITLALDPSLFKESATSFVPARYTSIEKISYDVSTKRLIWTMATCSSAGGYVPNWMVKLGLPPAVAKDVPHFLNWSQSDAVRSGQVL